jgi:hypothetical protein
MNEQEQLLYAEFVKRHCEAFSLSMDEFCESRPEVPRPVKVKETGHAPLEPELTLTIDLRFSGDDILGEIEEMVRRYKQRYEARFKEFIRSNDSGMPACHAELMLHQVRKGGLVSQGVSSRELETYRRQLEVYDLREREGLSFQQILQRCQWTDDEFAVQRHYAAAKRHVDMGPPFGPPFRRL